MERPYTEEYIVQCRPLKCTCPEDALGKAGGPGKGLLSHLQKTCPDTVSATENKNYLWVMECGNTKTNDFVKKSVFVVETQKLFK